MSKVLSGIYETARDTFGEVMLGEEFYRWADRQTRRYRYQKNADRSARCVTLGDAGGQVEFDYNEEVYRPVLAKMNAALRGGNEKGKR